MDLLSVLSYMFMAAGVLFMLFGATGLLQFKTFYLRILVASKIDTVGVLTLIIGIALRHGVSFFTGKLLLIVIIMLILNPLVAHILARSAYLSGQTADEDSQKGEQD